MNEVLHGHVARVTFPYLQCEESNVISRDITLNLGLNLQSNLIARETEITFSHL